MKIVKYKKLSSVEVKTNYMGCTFYLTGKNRLDDCIFDNCSFRGDELHYVDVKEKKHYAVFSNCSFTCGIVKMNIFVGGKIYKGGLLDSILDEVTHLVAIPRSKTINKLEFGRHLPKIETIDISSYEEYRELPINWFGRFPSLKNIILPANTGWHVEKIIEAEKKGLVFFQENRKIIPASWMLIRK